jgi:hypothetical protein
MCAFLRLGFAEAGQGIHHNMIATTANSAAVVSYVAA